MTIAEISFLGIIQGITEFLPVSSSGHLFLIETWLGHNPDLFIQIWLHAASLVAVLVYFRKRLISLFFGMFKKCSEQGIVLKLAISTLLTLPLALLLKKFLIDEGFLNLSLVGATLIITGLAIIVSERLSGQRREIGWLDAFLTGISQAISVIPGISRSGATIATLVSLGVSKRAAAEYSFLLSIPAILAALSFGLWEGRSQLGELADMSYLLPFILTSTVSYAVISYMLRFIEKQWIYFAPYCFVLGTALFFV